MTGRRMPWAHVAPSMQLSFELARNHQVSHGPKVVLHAVHYLLGLRQTLQDQISTTQIAREIGLWDGQGECPKGARETVGRHLGTLSDAGAITYQAAPGRGRLGTIALPDAEPIPGCACSDCKGKGALSTRPSGNKVAAGTRPSAGKGALSTRPSEQEGRAVEPERSRAAPRMPSERSRSDRDLPRVETPRSLPEVAAASDGPSPSGAVRSGDTPQGAGAEPPAQPATAGDLIYGLAHTEAEQDWAWDILTALEPAPPWFKDLMPARIHHQHPDSLHTAVRQITQLARDEDVDIRLPKGPK